MCKNAEAGKKKNSSTSFNKVICPVWFLPLDMLLLNDKDETGLPSKNATKCLCQAVMKYTTSYAKAANKSSQADTGQELIYWEVYAKSHFIFLEVVFLSSNWHPTSICKLCILRRTDNLNRISMPVLWFHWRKAKAFPRHSECYSWSKVSPHLCLTYYSIKSSCIKD